MHVGIPEYQFQNIDVDQLTDNLMKIKNLFMVQNNLDERILTYLKEKAPLCAEGKVLQRSKKINKEDTSMTNFPKTAYWRTLSPNDESVDKTTNPQFKNTRVPHVA